MRRKGFFIPCRYADATHPVRECAYPCLAPIFAEKFDYFADILRELERFSAEFSVIGQKSTPPAPRWDQDWFPSLDAAIAYRMVRAYRPRRLLEIGSGHSTRFFARAIYDGRIDCHMTAIDPAPRADLRRLDVSLLPIMAQNMDIALVDRLAAGDILSIDSSHILLPGTDVDFILGCVLPRLARGVILHFHDIFLPDGYPSCWDWRGYNEQCGLVFPIAAGCFNILWSSHYVMLHLARLVRAGIIGELSYVSGSIAASLWFEGGFGTP